MSKFRKKNIRKENSTERKGSKNYKLMVKGGLKTRTNQRRACQIKVERQRPLQDKLFNYSEKFPDGITMSRGNMHYCLRIWR